MLLGCTVALALSAAAAAPAPSVYWTSNPTLPNETLVVAGAFSEDRQAKLCTTRDCSGGSVVHHRRRYRRTPVRRLIRQSTSQRGCARSARDPC